MKFIPQFIPYWDEFEKKAVQKVLERDYLNEHKVVRQFEKDTQPSNNLYDSLQHIARTNFLRLKSNQNIWDIFTHDINQRIRKDSQVFKCKKRYETLLVKLIKKAQKTYPI